MPIPEPESFQLTLKHIGLISTGVVTTLGALKYWALPKIRNGRNSEPPFTEEKHGFICTANLAELVKDINKTITDGYEKMSDKMDAKLTRVYDLIERRHTQSNNPGHKRRRED